MIKQKKNRVQKAQRQFNLFVKGSLFALVFLLPAFAVKASQQENFQENLQPDQWAAEYRVYHATEAEVKSLSQNQHFSLDHVAFDQKSGTYQFELYTRPQFEPLLKKMKLLLIKQPPLSSKQFDDYLSSAQVAQKMRQLEKKYPNLIKIIEIGKSVKGQPLLFARLTTQPNIKLPEFKYVANMHGDEIVGRELMLRFIEDLAKNASTDAQIAKLLGSAHLYIMPSMNPDGADARRRSNANGTDLNRDFPDFRTQDNQNTMQDREPETQAMMKFQASHSFKLSANFHGGSVVVNYPWDAQASSNHPLESLLIKMSKNYAKASQYIFNSEDCKPGGGIPKCVEGTVRGYDWYSVYKGMQDWSYYWHKDLQVTIELSDIKWPQYSEIDQYYTYNRPALLRYIEEMFEF